MNLEHCGLLSWVHERRESPAQKNHAQDCETLIGLRNQRPAILPWSRCAGWLSSFECCGQKLLAFNPRDGHLARHRPVAGLLLGERCRQTKCACTWKLHDLIEKPKNAFPDHAQKRARDARANRTQRRMLCFSSSAL